MSVMRTAKMYAIRASYSVTENHLVLLKFRNGLRGNTESEVRRNRGRKPTGKRLRSLV